MALSGTIRGARDRPHNVVAACRVVVPCNSIQANLGQSVVGSHTSCLTRHLFPPRLLVS